MERELRGVAKVIIISIENCTARLSVTLDAKTLATVPSAILMIPREMIVAIFVPRAAPYSEGGY